MRSRWLRGSIYWVLLVSGRFSVIKPLSQIQRSTSFPIRPVATRPLSVDSGLPEAMKHWSLTSLQTRMLKTGGRLVRHAGRLVFQLAEVLVSREMLGGILERIGRLSLAPG